MRVALRLVVTEAGGRTRSLNVMRFEKIGDLAEIGGVGLSLAQAKIVLSQLQKQIVAVQARRCAERPRSCRRCGGACHIKDRRTRALDTLFGRTSVALVRFACLECGHLDLGVDWPPRCRSTPELDRTRAHLSALMSYQSAAGVLTALLPVEAGDARETLRRHTLRLGERLASAPVAKIDEAPAQITIGIDSTFIRGRGGADHRRLEVVVGKMESERGDQLVFGSIRGARPGVKAVLHRGLDMLGRSPTSAITAFTDGDPYLRKLLKHGNICEKPILDWFHIGMRLQNLKQSAAGLPTRVPSQQRAKEVISAEIERLHWRLWHGKDKNALKAIDAIRGCMRAFKSERQRRAVPPPSRRVWRDLFEIDRYVSGQSGWIVNYGERHRADLRVGTAPTESTANYLVNKRMNKSQQMTWSKRGANLLLQVRCALYNGILDAPIGAPVRADVTSLDLADAA
jgi:hypothetical protein